MYLPNMFVILQQIVAALKVFLERTRELNPELTFIPEIIKLYTRTGELWNELETIGGGFNVTLEILHDKEKRKAIASKIREIGMCMDKVSLLFQSIRACEEFSVKAFCDRINTGDSKNQFCYHHREQFTEKIPRARTIYSLFLCLR